MADEDSISTRHGISATTDLSISSLESKGTQGGVHKPEVYIFLRLVNPLWAFPTAPAKSDV